MGAESAKPAAGVPPHGDGRRGGPARRRRVRAGLGERRRVLLRVVLDDTALDRPRRRGHLARPPPLGQQRPDDVLLLRRRARGAPRVRPRRAARAAAVRLPLLAGDRRDGASPSRSTSPSTPADSRRTGWGIAMSTDTAFALGLLALVGAALPDRLRAFMLTVVVVDDIVALVVIATVVHRGPRARRACSWPSGFFAAVLVVARALGVRSGLVYFVLGPARVGRAARVGGRPGRRRARDGPARLRLPGSRGRTSSGRRSVPRSSASSRPPSWRASAREGLGRRSRPTSGCSSSSTRGRAT